MKFFNIRDAVKEYTETFNFLYQNTSPLIEYKVHSHLFTINKNEDIQIYNESTHKGYEIHQDTWQQNMNINVTDMHDVYISKNLLTDKPTKSTGCKADDVEVLKNVVIDIDCHGKNCNRKDIKKKFMQQYSEIFKDLSKSTLIVWSGRGFHLWFNLEAAYISYYKEMYSEVSEKIAKVFAERLRMLKFDILGLNVDIASCRSIHGLARVFGTYNYNAVKLTKKDASCCQKQLGDMQKYYVEAESVDTYELTNSILFDRIAMIDKQLGYCIIHAL